MAVVGAGLAGLAAARDLMGEGCSVVVLEARNRVGGRLLNEPIGDGKVVEVGGQWIGPTQDRLAALAADMGVGTFPTYTRGENLLEWRGRLRRYRGTIPRVSPLALADFARAQRRLNRMAREVPLDRPWEAPKAREWDSMTARTWQDRHLRTRGAQEMLELAIEAVWAAEPEDFSLLHMLFYIHSAGSLEMLFDTEGGAQQDRFVGGSQLVAQRWPSGSGPETVIRSAPVRRIEHGPDRRDRARRRRRRRARAPRGRGDRALAGGPHRLRPAAAGAPRPAHPAHAAGHGGQVHGHLRRALLARAGPQRPGHQRRRPGEAHLRQLTARRLARGAAGLPRGRARP